METREREREKERGGRGKASGRGGREGEKEGGGRHFGACVHEFMCFYDSCGYLSIVSHTKTSLAQPGKHNMDILTYLCTYSIIANLVPCLHTV